MIDDFVRDVSHGARLLRRNPGFAAVVLATLGIAIGATARKLVVENFSWEGRLAGFDTLLAS